MTGDRRDEEKPDAPSEPSVAELRAKVADLEGRLEDALRLKREVESQAEVIRVLTGRLQEEMDDNKEMGNQLTAFYSTLTYRTKAAVYRQVQPMLDRLKHRGGAASKDFG